MVVCRTMSTMIVGASAAAPASVVNSGTIRVDGTTELVKVGGHSCAIPEANKLATSICERNGALGLLKGRIPRFVRSLSFATTR
jgi:hypothetical protein